MNEKDYLQGSRNAYRFMMLHCMRELGIQTDDKSIEEKLASLFAEREEALSVLRRICEDHGDNEWDEKLHLADIIDKHLGRHLEG